jgi:hypothetical protein
MGRQQNYPDRSGINRYGEENIRPDIYEDEAGMRHPLLGKIEHSIEWSSDPRSESAAENHRGKGPRNFSRSDELLREKVCELFLMDPDLDPGEIEVSVNDGLVTLNGHVFRREDRYLAEDLAFYVSGVKDVINLLSR